MKEWVLDCWHFSTNLQSSPTDFSNSSKLAWSFVLLLLFWGSFGCEDDDDGGIDF